MAVKIDGLLVVNLYNQKPQENQKKRSKKEREGREEEVRRGGRKRWTIERINIVRIVREASRWVVAGDFNATHPRWTGKAGVRGAWREVLKLLQQGVLANSVGKPTFQRVLRSGIIQESTIDLTISSGIMI